MKLGILAHGTSDCPFVGLTDFAPQEAGRLDESAHPGQEVTSVPTEGVTLVPQSRRRCVEQKQKHTTP